MSPKPAKWGSDVAALPPSLTPEGARPAALADVTATGRGSCTAKGGDACAHLFDDNSSTEAHFALTAPLSITYDLKQDDAAAVRFYTLTSGGKGGHPTDWVLVGSNDGTGLKELDRRTGEAFDWAHYTRPFRLATPARYRHYRLTVTAASQGRDFSLAEVELLGAGRDE